VKDHGPVVQLCLGKQVGRVGLPDGSVRRGAIEVLVDHRADVVDEVAVTDCGVAIGNG